MATPAYQHSDYHYPESIQGALIGNYPLMNSEELYKLAAEVDLSGILMDSLVRALSQNPQFPDFRVTAFDVFKDMLLFLEAIRAISRGGPDNVVDLTQDDDMFDLTGDEHVVDLTCDEHVVDLTGDEHVVELTGDEHVVDLTGDEHIIDLTQDDDLTQSEFRSVRSITYDPPPSYTA